MKLDVDFTDDKPVFDWSEYEQPPKFWRAAPPPKLTGRELLKAFLAFLAFVVPVAVGLIAALVY